MTRRNILGFGGLIGAAIVLSACQVQPLYGTSPLNSSNVNASSALAGIEINSPANRLDQVVRNELKFRLGNGVKPAESGRYTLKIVSTKNIRSVGISDVDFGPAAFFVTVDTDYILRDSTRAAPIAQGTESGTASYDRVDQEFANVRAEKDAEERAAKTVAEKMRFALALALEAQAN